MASLQNAGLSHSDIRGSKVICTSPRLFAAYHVLHRLREPRHPPCALSFFFLSYTEQSRVYFQLQLLLGLLQHVIDRIRTSGSGE